MTHDTMRRSATVCTAVTGSMTMALKAQRSLARQAIRASTVKVSRATSSRGCIYGIEFDCSLTGNVRAVLEEAGVEIKEYLR